MTKKKAYFPDSRGRGWPTEKQASLSTRLYEEEAHQRLVDGIPLQTYEQPDNDGFDALLPVGDPCKKCKQQVYVFTCSDCGNTREQGHITERDRLEKERYLQYKNTPYYELLTGKHKDNGLFGRFKWRAG